MTVELRLLGGFEIAVDGRRVDDAAWRSRKARNLVKLLCLAPGHRVHREQVLDLLWGELDPVAAGNNLRSALHAARRAMEPDRTAGAAASLLRTGDGMISLASDVPLAVDVVEFERAVAIATRAGTTQSLQHAIDLYGGELLPEDRYEEWTQRRRESLRGMFVSSLVDLAALHAARRPRDAIALLQRVVEVDPLHEPVHVELMRLYARIDDRRQAQLQFERLREALRDELGVDPAPASERAYAAVLAGEVPGGRDEDEHRGADRGEQHLPEPLTTFVGRVRDLEAVGGALRSTRLLSLVGAGGSGKTRLALEVARASAAGFDGGAWLVELAPIADASLVPQTVASALGVREEATRTATDAVIERIGDQRVLLLLDNCEHMLASCSVLVAELLAACPQLTVVATSRAALRAPGETVWRVPLLDVPAAGASAAQITTADSVQLFVDRARSVQATFALTTDNAETVAAICRELDGLPLAIELAAARVPAISLADLRGRLGNALQVLTTGSRAAEPRQRTLRATLHWSFDLLSDAERTLLQRSSVFRGGWTLDAMEEIASDAAVPRDAVLDLLAGLVDTSLVVTASDGGNRLRYRTLEPVRQFAAEMHERRDDAPQLHERHASWFLGFADTAIAALHGADQASWLERLHAEHDNLRAALDWAFDHDLEIAVRLAGRLWRFWYIRGHLREGRAWIDRAFARAPSLPPHLRARALLAAGQMRATQAEYDEGRKVLLEALALLRSAGGDDVGGLADTLSALAITLFNQGEFEQARTYLEENIELERRAQNAWGISRSLSNLAEMAFAQGDHLTAEQYWDECLPIDVAMGDTRDVAITLHNLGEVRRARGDLAAARQGYAESLERFREVEFVLGTASSLTNLAEVMVEQRDELAAEVLGEALQVTRALGHPVVTATLFEMVAKFAAIRGEVVLAARLFGAANSLRETTGAHLSPLERRKIEPWLTAALETVEPDLRRAWAQGGTLPTGALLDEAAAMVEAAARDPFTSPASQGEVDLGRLTAREREIVDLLGDALTNREIAERIGISKATADKHVGNILRKLGVASRAELVGPLR